MAMVNQVQYSYPGSLKSLMGRILHPSVRAQTYLRLSTYHFSPVVLQQEVLGERGLSYTIMLHDVCKFWVLGFENLCSSLATFHLLCRKTFLERWTCGIKLLAIFSSANAAWPSWRDGSLGYYYVASNCSQFLGMQILGLGFENFVFPLCCLSITSPLMSCLISWGWFEVVCVQFVYINGFGRVSLIIRLFVPHILKMGSLSICGRLALHWPIDRPT